MIAEKRSPISPARLLASPLALALAFALPAAARAQAPAGAATTADNVKNVARALADTGKQRFDAGDYEGAIEALLDAEKYYKAPTITRLRALAHEKLGQLLRARQLCEQVAGEALPQDAPPEFAAAHDDCAKLARSLDARIPSVRIVLSNEPPGARVTVDGRSLDGVALASRIRLDPGKHTITVEAPPAAPVTRELDLPEKAVRKVTFDLSPAAPAADRTTVSSDPDDTPATRMIAPAVAFGVGGAGLLVGVVTGAMTLAKGAEIRGLCGRDSVCPEAERERVGLESAKTVGYVSTAAFALAGAGAAVGVVLLLLPGDKKEASARAGSGPRLSATLGPAFVGVKGAF